MTTVVITGASTGIGRSLALAWAPRKVTLVLSARGKDALDEVARAVEKEGSRAIVVPGDVTSATDREALVARALETGGIDVLVNNAGRGYYAATGAIDIDDARKLFELNVFAPLALSQLAMKHLEARRGAIVMMSSVAGMVSAPKLGAYAASKFALEALSMSMRAELADLGVRVLVVRPGPVYTPFRDNAVRGGGETENAEPDPNAQSADDVARRPRRALERERATLETTRSAWAIGVVSRLSPAGLRFALRRMARPRS